MDQQERLVILALLLIALFFVINYIMYQQDLIEAQQHAIIEKEETVELLIEGIKECNDSLERHKDYMAKQRQRHYVQYQVTSPYI